MGIATSYSPVLGHARLVEHIQMLENLAVARRLHRENTQAQMVQPTVNACHNCTAPLPKDGKCLYCGSQH